MLPTCQNRCGVRENLKGSKFSVNAHKWFLYEAFQLLSNTAQSAQTLLELFIAITLIQ